MSTKCCACHVKHASICHLPNTLSTNRPTALTQYERRQANADGQTLPNPQTSTHIREPFATHSGKNKNECKLQLNNRTRHNMTLVHLHWNFLVVHVVCVSVCTFALFRFLFALVMYDVDIHEFNSTQILSCVVTVWNSLVRYWPVQIQAQKMWDQDCLSLINPKDDVSMTSNCMVLLLAPDSRKLQEVSRKADTRCSIHVFDFFIGNTIHSSQFP